jgi:hypothetical protein
VAQVQAAWALQALMEDYAASQQELLRAGGAASIVAQLRFPEQWNWAPLLGVLHSLARGADPAAVEELLRSGCVPVLADVLTSGRPSLQVPNSPVPWRRFVGAKGFLAESVLR